MAPWLRGLDAAWVAGADAEVSRFGDAVPPLFWLRDPQGNTLIVGPGLVN